MKEKVEKFIAFYRGQKIEEKRRIREEFLQKSKMSYPAWYSKMSRKVFSQLEIEALSEITGEDFAN